MKRLILPVIIIAVIIGFVWLTFFKNDAGTAGSSYSLATPADTDTPSTGGTGIIPPYSLALSETYSNSDFSFSFKYPSAFKVSALPAEEGSTILIQDQTAKGFQINIQKIDEDVTTITADRIREDLPDMVINEPQDVNVGAKGKGLAFISDNPAFDGESREVWFVHNRTLYQITTYRKYDPLVQAVLGSWEFK